MWVCDLWTCDFFFLAWMMDAIHKRGHGSAASTFVPLLPRPTNQKDKFNLNCPIRICSSEFHFFLQYIFITWWVQAVMPYMFAQCRSCQPIPKEILLYNFCGINSCANSVVQCAISRKGLCTDYRVPTCSTLYHWIVRC